jgi:Rieske Fe-S protein
MAKANDPRKLPPQTDDDIVFPSWQNDGRAIRVDDIPLGGPPILAYPRDPATQVAREKSRLNQILLLRFAEDELSDATKKNSVLGIIAYSGVCTHTGCSVTEWDADTRNLLCPCHASQFDPRERAKIIGGPARRPLPILPLALKQDTLKVAGPFDGKVGAKKKK